MNTLLLLESGRITRYRIAAGTRRRPSGFLGSQLARAAVSESLTCCVNGPLRDRLPPSAPEGRDGTRLAAEHFH